MPAGGYLLWRLVNELAFCPVLNIDCIGVPAVCS